MNDYSETRACLLRLVGTLEEARLKAGRANLPPALSPMTVRRHIDHLDDLLDQAQAEIAAARTACMVAGRGGLSVID